MVESIRRFPDQRELADFLVDAGFASVRWRNLWFGIACIHSGAKS
ncbi:class I SAM-dependent methyltransferase [Rhodoblastus sp.]